MGKNTNNRPGNGGNSQNNNQRGNWRNNNQNNNQGGNRENNNGSTQSQKTPSRPCNACGVLGHWNGDCQKPGFNNRSNPNQNILIPSKPCNICGILGHWNGDCQKHGFVPGQNMKREPRPLNPCRDCGRGHRHGSCLTQGTAPGDPMAQGNTLYQHVVGTTSFEKPLPTHYQDSLPPAFGCGNCSGNHWQAGCPYTFYGRTRLGTVVLSMQGLRWEPGWIEGVDGCRDYQIDRDGDIVMTDFDAVPKRSPWDSESNFNPNHNQKQRKNRHQKNWNGNYQGNDNNHNGNNGNYQGKNNRGGDGRHGEGRGGGGGRGRF